MIEALSRWVEVLHQEGAVGLLNTHSNPFLPLHSHMHWDHFLFYILPFINACLSPFFILFIHVIFLALVCPGREEEMETKHQHQKMCFAEGGSLCFPG